jgi:integrase/recombinase XerC
MRLTAATAHFDRQLAANGCSVHTQKAYTRDLRAFARWLGRDAALSAIAPDNLARFLVSDGVLLTPSGSPRKPITVNRTKSALRSFFAFCLESGWIKENPARLIRSARTTAREPATLTEAEIQLLRQALSDRTETLAHRGGRARRFGTNAHRKRDRLIFELLLGTGIRLGSLVALDRGDVDLQAGILHIRTKGGGEDRVFLNPVLVRMLGRFLRNNAPEANRGPHAPLFRSRWGTRLGPRPIQLRFAALCRKAGITGRVSIHSLRHTFATRLYHKTGDLYLVQRALGHRHITTTEVYARVSDQALRHAMVRS